MAVLAAMADCHGRAYVPRQTQICDALTIVREHLPAFVERLEDAGGTLPDFVARELSALLTCGDFRHGFVVVQCRRCAEQRPSTPKPTTCAMSGNGSTSTNLR